MYVHNKVTPLNTILLNHVSTSSVARFDKHLRLRVSIKSRLRSIDKAFDFYNSSNIGFTNFELSRAHDRFRSAYLLKLRLVSFLDILDINNTMYRAIKEGLVIPLYTNEDLYKEVFPLFTNLGSTYEMLNHIFSGHSVMVQKYKFNFRTTTKNRLVNSYYKSLSNSSKKSLKNLNISRFVWSTVDRMHQGWFTVFQTLTVSNSNMGVVFDLRSRLVTDYIRKLKRLAFKATFPDKVERITSDSSVVDYFDYFCVAEQGTDKGRLHLHLVLMFKKFPTYYLIPPNDSNDLVLHDNFKSLWSYGRSLPIAVRYGVNDAFSKVFWPIPTEYDEINKIKVCKTFSTPVQLALYLGKYLSKTYVGQQGVKIWNKNKTEYKIVPMRRLSMTRGLGCRLINQNIKKLTELELLKLLTLNKCPLYLYHRTIPLPFLKSLILKNLLMRNCDQLKKKSVKNYLMQISRNTVTKTLMDRMPHSIIKLLLSDIIQPQLIYNPSSLQIMYLKLMKSTDISRILYDRFRNYR